MAETNSGETSGLYDFDAPSHVDFRELLDAEFDDHWFGKCLRNSWIQHRFSFSSRFTLGNALLLCFYDLPLPVWTEIGGGVAKHVKPDFFKWDQTFLCRGKVFRNVTIVLSIQTRLPDKWTDSKWMKRYSKFVDKQQFKMLNILTLMLYKIHNCQQNGVCTYIYIYI